MRAAILLLLVSACGEYSALGEHATCVDSDGEMVFEGAIRSVYTNGEGVTTIKRPDLSRVIFTGDEVRCRIEREAPERPSN